MHCIKAFITFSKYSIDFIGCLVGYFRAGSKGFRQGVLLSFYLFVLAKEDFSKFLKKGVKQFGNFYGSFGLREREKK